MNNSSKRSGQPDPKVISKLERLCNGGTFQKSAYVDQVIGSCTPNEICWFERNHKQGLDLTAKLWGYCPEYAEACITYAYWQDPDSSDWKASEHPLSKDFSPYYDKGEIQGDVCLSDQFERRVGRAGQIVPFCRKED